MKVLTDAMKNKKAQLSNVQGQIASYAQKVRTRM